jgi:excisionase family DNA binding protein
VSEPQELRAGPLLAPKWYSVAQVAQMLGFGLSKTKMLVATGELRSLKDGKNRRILPEWVDEYIERRVKEGAAMSSRARANGEGSIFPYRNGFAAYVWVTKPNGQRQRKYVYGTTRQGVHDKWLKLQQQARQGPMATCVPQLGEFLT